MRVFFPHEIAFAKNTERPNEKKHKCVCFSKKSRQKTKTKSFSFNLSLSFFFFGEKMGATAASSPNPIADRVDAAS